MSAIQIRVNGRWTTMADAGEYDPAIHGPAVRIPAPETLVELANGQLLPVRLHNTELHGPGTTIPAGAWHDPTSVIQDRVRVACPGALTGMWVNAVDHDVQLHGPVLETRAAGAPEPAPDPALAEDV